MKNHGPSAQSRTQITPKEESKVSIALRHFYFFEENQNNQNLLVEIWNLYWTNVQERDIKIRISYEIIDTGFKIVPPKDGMLLIEKFLCQLVLEGKKEAGANRVNLGIVKNHNANIQYMQTKL